MSQSKRLGERKYITPGPNQYNIDRPNKGQMRSILGGKLSHDQVVEKDEDNVGPGTYFNGDLDPDQMRRLQQPGMRIMGPTERKKKLSKDLEKKKNQVPPHSYAKEIIHEITRDSKGPKMKPHAGRKKKVFNTPGANAYDVLGHFDIIGKKGGKFTMGVKTQLSKSNVEVPGPGEYDSQVANHKVGATHLIGTSHRSDLGVGKSYLSPGPGQYDIRGKIGGAKVGFGRQKKTNKVEKTYLPGPASYNIPGTVGNLPKYLLNSKRLNSKNRKQDRSM